MKPFVFFVAALLIVGSFAGACVALSMNVTVDTESFVGTVNNMGLLADRQLYFTASTGGFLLGVLLMIGCYLDGIIRMVVEPRVIGEE